MNDLHNEPGTIARASWPELWAWKIRPQIVSGIDMCFAPLRVLCIGMLIGGICTMIYFAWNLGRYEFGMQQNVIRILRVGQNAQVVHAEVVRIADGLNALNKSQVVVNQNQSAIAAELARLRARDEVVEAALLRAKLIVAVNP